MYKINGFFPSAEHYRQARQRAGLSLQQLGHLLGRSHSGIQAIENRGPTVAAMADHVELHNALCAENLPGTDLIDFFSRYLILLEDEPGNQLLFPLHLAPRSDEDADAAFLSRLTTAFSAWAAGHSDWREFHDGVRVVALAKAPSPRLAALEPALLYYQVKEPLAAAA